jgi:hypothetical protein
MATQQHLGAGAYALGVMDPVDAWHFAAHADECARCTARLREFARLEVVLADFAASLPPGETWVPRPSRGLMDRMLGEAAARRASRRRRLRLVGAVAALVVGGSALTGLEASGPVPGKPPNPEQQVLALSEKARHTDPGTRVSVTVGMEKTAWGTEVGLELRHVPGPLKCQLVAVGRTGEEETVTSWSVPARGYGIPGSGSEDEVLYAQGGTAMNRKDIDRFEVRTLDGKRLAMVKA